MSAPVTLARPAVAGEGSTMAGFRRLLHRRLAVPHK